MTIARVRVNPFALSITVEGFQIFEADGSAPFVGFRKLYVNAQLSSVYRRAPVIKEVTLDGLRVSIARLKGPRDDLADARRLQLQRHPGAPRGATAPSRRHRPTLTRAAALLAQQHPPHRRGDRASMIGPLHSRHQITELNVGVPFVSTLPVYVDSFVEPGLSVAIDGTPFALAGHTKPFTDRCRRWSTCGWTRWT